MGIARVEPLASLQLLFLLYACISSNAVVCETIHGRALASAGDNRSRGVSTCSCSSLFLPS
ncbi:hypothetical protein CRG98_008682 [Punica granatum]|uniref:Secreted protein n=1 Tax=Punica granatum TaxID=22663 RepID=A0A2I0KR54_PUNGR|nr:hypothetical protein CRG98_008682 [Punica granatum]